MKKELYIIFKTYNSEENRYEAFYDNVKEDYDLIKAVEWLNNRGYKVENIEPYFDEKIRSARFCQLRDELEKVNAELPF